MTNLYLTDVINDCLVLYRTEDDGVIKAKHPRDFPPRRSYPIAIVKGDGQIERLTCDELPDNLELLSYVRHLRIENAGTPLKPSREGLPLEDVEAIAERIGKRKTLLAIDVSGGMDPSRSQAWAMRFCAEEHLEIKLFDTELFDFDPEDPTRHLHGLGAAFDHVQAYAEAQDEHPHVVVLTDGMAPHISPARPELWTWVVTQDGDPWPSRRTTGAMTTVFTY